MVYFQLFCTKEATFVTSWFVFPSEKGHTLKGKDLEDQIHSF